MKKVIPVFILFFYLASLASAQTKTKNELLQNSAGNQVTLAAPSTVTNNTILFPGTLGLQGGLLYISSVASTVGTTSWLNPGTNGYILSLSGGLPVWSDPTVLLAGSYWSLAGNAPAAAYNGTTGSFLGTTNTQPMVLATTNATTQPIEFFNGGLERARIASTGQFLVGTTTPLATVTVNGETFSNTFLPKINEANPAYLEGRVFYDSTEHALSYYNEASGEPLSIGQENLIRVRNISGTTIANGSAVYINGDDAISGLPTIGLAKADQFVTSNAIGLAENAILNNGIGYINSFGIIDNFNTSGFASGATLYVSATTAGAVTSTRPNQPNFTNPIGYVEYVGVLGGVLVMAGNTRQGAMTTGAIAFGGTDGYIKENPTSLFFDSTNIRLGIGTNIPTSTLTVKGETFSNTFLPATNVANPPYIEGRVFYDSTEHALSYYNEASAEPVSIAQENLIRVKNITGVAIAHGSAVYLSGDDAASGLPTIALAKADQLSTADAIGIAENNIANNAIGYISSVGIIDNINTSTFAAGATLYVSATTPGAITSTRPSQPNFTNPIGFVEIFGATGAVLVMAGKTRQGAMTKGAVGFGGSDGSIKENPTGFFFDSTDVRLGIGTNIPTSTLTVNGETYSNTFLAQVNTFKPAWQEGRFFYDTAEKTMAYYNDHNGVTLNVGQEEWVRVYNASGASIANGSAVYINGDDATTGLPTVALAIANAITTSEGVAIATETIPNNSLGYVTAFGVIHNLNTSAYAPGAPLYVSPTTAGALTSTRPSQPNFACQIGFVAAVSIASGKIMVKPTKTLYGMYTPGAIAFGGTDGLIKENPTGLFFDSTNVRLGVGTNAPGQKLEAKNGNILLSNNTATAGQLQFQGTSTGITTVQAGAQGATNLNYTLPITAPTAGQVLSSTAAGILSWAANNGSGWSLLGNTGTTGSNFLGTTDSYDLVIKTNNAYRMSIVGGVTNTGNVAIGTTSITTTTAAAAIGDKLTILGGDLSFNSESNSAITRSILFRGTAGSGNFRIGADGGDIFWQGGGAQNLQMGCFWRIDLLAQRQVAGFPAFSAEATDCHIYAPLIQPTIPGFILRGATSQSADLMQWQNSSSTVLASVSATGTVYGTAMGAGTTAPNTVLDVNGDLAMHYHGITLSSDSTDNLAVGAYSYIGITGRSNNYVITGISGGVDGKVIQLINLTPKAMKLYHQNAGSSAANRFYNPSGQDITIADSGIVGLVYNSLLSCWVLQSSVSVMSGTANFTIRRQKSDQSITNSTTFKTATDFNFNAMANSVYEIEIVVFDSGVGGSYLTGIASVPTGSTITGSVVTSINGHVAADVDILRNGNYSSGGGSNTMSGVAGTAITHAILTTGSTAGVCTFTWGMLSSGIGETIWLFKDSYAIIRLVGKT